MLRNYVSRRSIVSRRTMVRNYVRRDVDILPQNILINKVPELWPVLWALTKFT